MATIQRSSRTRALSGVIGAFQEGELGFKLVDAGVQLSDGDVLFGVTALELFDFELEGGIFHALAVEFLLQAGDTVRPIFEVEVRAFEDGIDDVNIVGALFEAEAEEVAEETTHQGGNQGNEDIFGHAEMRLSGSEMER